MEMSRGTPQREWHGVSSGDFRPIAELQRCGARLQVAWNIPRLFDPPLLGMFG